MKAVIMAGGEGNRLRPLTCDIPKPMVRLLGKPIIMYILELLAKHRIEDAAVTIRYLPLRITEAFPMGAYAGVSLDFVEEDKPLGTAGSVKNACRGYGGEVLVISGDAMCDFDLTRAVAYHREKKADATLLVKAVEDPREYGLVNCDENGIITGFIEKPAFSQAVSDLANTGIYILSPQALELIQEDQPFDFAKDLFPLMLERGMRLAACRCEGYWCDIGDLSSYISCQRDILAGKVVCRVSGERRRDGSIYAEGSQELQCELRPPVYIGRGVRVEDSAVVENSVLDDGCYVGAGARVSGSLMLPGAYVDSGAKMTGALVCAKATIKSKAMLFEGAAVGAEAIVGENAVIYPGIKVWNKKTVPEGVVVSDHVKISEPIRESFDEEGIIGQIGVEVTPEFCARLGSAIGTAAGGKKVGVGCCGLRASNVLKQALIAGIRATGADVLDFGDNFRPLFEFSMNFCALGIGVFIGGSGKAKLQLICEGGLPATRSIEREIEGVLARGEFARRPYYDYGDKAEMSGIQELYKSQLMRLAPQGLSDMAVQVKSKSLPVQNILRQTLERLGCDTVSGPVLELSGQGDKVRLFDEEEGYLPHHKLFTLCCIGEFQSGRDAAVPFDAPRIIDSLAEKAGRRVFRYFQCPADDSDREARKLAKIQLWSRDALMQSVKFLHLVKRCHGLKNTLDLLPPFHMVVRTVNTRGNPANMIRAVAGDGKGISEGVVIPGDGGNILIRPLKRGNGIRIYAESVSNETAAELCAGFESLFSGQKINEE